MIKMTHNVFNSVRLPNVLGIGPVNELFCTFNVTKFDKFPSSLGKGPLISLSWRILHVSQYVIMMTTLWKHTDVYTENNSKAMLLSSHTDNLIQCKSIWTGMDLVSITMSLFLTYCTFRSLRTLTGQNLSRNNT